jgi:hypothetical protein
MDTRTVRRLTRALEPLHSLIYFAPEQDEQLAAVGLKPGRMCYFASRAAAMGAVGPEVVTATFYNFNPGYVAHHIPAAWALADPATVLGARLAAADAALRRLLGDAVGTPEVAEAADLARLATEVCATPGRPLYAGHAELPWPTEPHLVLWHAITLLREYRGDGHLAALAVGGLDGLPALIAHAASGHGFLNEFARRSRGWSEAEWAQGSAELRERGLLAEDGSLTEDGTALRERIEADTDRLDQAPWDHLGEERAARLLELGRGLAKQVQAAGAFPEGVFTPRR